MSNYMQKKLSQYSQLSMYEIGEIDAKEEPPMLMDTTPQSS